MKAKPVTPYARLLDDFKKFCDEIEFRNRRRMFIYKKDELGKSWDMKQLFERVAAAEQLGYDVIVTANDDGLTFTYWKKLPFRPWSVK